MSSLPPPFVFLAPLWYNTQDFRTTSTNATQTEPQPEGYYLPGSFGVYNLPAIPYGSTAHDAQEVPPPSASPSPSPVPVPVLTPIPFPAPVPYPAPIEIPLPALVPVSAPGPAPFPALAPLPNSAPWTDHLQREKPLPAHADPSCRYVADEKPQTVYTYSRAVGVIAFANRRVCPVCNGVCGT